MGEPEREPGDEELEPRGNQDAVLESTAACTSVDAGAGTGKTTTMLMRIEHAIETGAVDPGDVLVLTFANEAAGSIRDAVADRLDPETAAAIDVYTYHSFCHRLVREYAYYLGYSPEFDVVTDRKRRRLIGRLLAENDYGFAAATGDGSPAELTADVDGFIQEMSQEDVTPGELQKALPDVRTLELLTEFVLWLERRANEELSFDAEALRYFNAEDHLETASESLVDYGKLIQYCREKIDESPAFGDSEVVRDVERYLEILQDCVTETIETLSLEERETKQLPRALFYNRIRRDATDRIEQSPFGRLKHYVEFLRLARHYTDVYGDYHDALENRGALDFDELVRKATQLLNDESIASEITDRWEQVYCDEFQDTDETQFSLLTGLTDGHDRPSLFAIGDKDQAIYGWRGTDRRGLDRLASVYDDHDAVELGLNFRSRQEILDLTNCCGYGPQSSKTLREADRTPGEYGDYDDYERADDDTGLEEPPDHVVTIESGEIDRPMAEQVGTTVSRLLNGEAENVPRRRLEDVAVVVRTNRHAQAVAEALESRRIPYEVSGSPGGDVSPGIRTVLSYLRVLVDSDADAHLRRVLFYRYRLPESDLRTLQQQDGPLVDAVFEVDSETLERPDRLERARDHLETLAEYRRLYPLSGFLRRFREVTRLEWFLTSDERAEFDRIERFVDAYDADSMLRMLSAEFLEALENTLEGSESERTRGTHSSDYVDVMTVHQAKGLEFDTVLVPFLSDEEWCVEADYARRSRERLLAALLSDDLESPLRSDLAAETVGEEWRVLHVALTRAENHLFLFGAEYDYEGEDAQLGVETADACLPDAIEWSTAGQRMDLWESLTESFEDVREIYPETVADRTTELARSSGVTPGSITYYADYEDRQVEPLRTREAIETVHQLGRLLRDDALLPAADAASYADGRDDGVRVPGARRLSTLTEETVRFPVETLSEATELPVAISHSYTAMETHDTCPRKHYLDHVVRAIDDPGARGETSSGDGGSRVVGTVFHDVAEEAFYREYESREEWHEAATRQLTARGLTDHREDVLACVDRYFGATADGFDRPVADWDQLAAELPFSLADVAGVTGNVVGYVDSVRRTPDGELVVLDYKATAERADPTEAVQLVLYARACEQRFDEPVSAVGYVYVGDVDSGPRAELVDPESDELPEWESVLETFVAADDPDYFETTPGNHCRYCPHRSLGCGPDGLEDRRETRGRPQAR
ncbi:UvrD-helicase domain-containing protein [Natronobacterium gregoryi]|uniref:DNA 3'-5' helicase n=2 Tax=Natronobacterium gregoryi TaxID=44930 RepID=L0ANW2_NATGS|nr:UvrD-helicase domain-containing protein [Natronobacterium gregoryi]AFZ74770.1 ATP-dependent exonuclase V beta subunit, helicase and exonuclease domain-containing [Natronobacterium gregoryi SP2]ELY73559.1 UvrD/REP helicase [Natronobacterium gregoryi SP2]PLK19413.1 PD-(D/E)XK nuclease family protein [Natronobacterium gregoryi SP2]SFJ49530.1 ATP-dependent helicase/nuclease subunit A [Natronobacterium gregoryi]